MSNYIEEIAHVRDLDRIADACESIANMLAADGLAVPTADRLARLEAILLDLYPDSCTRHGLVAAVAVDATRRVQLPATD